jgi:hypothetical protein
MMFQKYNLFNINMKLVRGITNVIIIGLLVAIIYFVIKNNNFKFESFANYGNAGCPPGTTQGINSGGLPDCVMIPNSRRNLGN